MNATHKVTEASGGSDRSVNEQHRLQSLEAVLLDRMALYRSLDPPLR